MMGKDLESAEYDALKAAREMAAKDTRVAMERIARAIVRDEQRSEADRRPEEAPAGTAAGQ